MSDSIKIPMKRRVESAGKGHIRVRVRVRSTEERKKGLSVLKVILVLMGAAVGGVVLGIIIVKLIIGVIKANHDERDIPSDTPSVSNVIQPQKPAKDNVSPTP